MGHGAPREGSRCAVVALHPAVVHPCCQEGPARAKGGDLIATEQLNTAGPGNPLSR